MAIMNKLEIDALIILQLEAVSELIEVMPTPEVWHKELQFAISRYKKSNLIHPEHGINYVRSGIKDLIKRLVRFASGLGLPEAMFIKPIELNTEVSSFMTLDEILATNEFNDSGMIKIYPQRTIECIESYQAKIDDIPKIIQVSMDICSCGVKLDIDHDTGTMNCPLCSRYFESMIVVFNEERGLPNHDSQKSKSNTYKVSKHFETWLNRILAIEVKAGAPALVPKIREYFHSTGIPRDLITYGIIRNYLKKYKLKDYYESVSWLLKEVTGRLPPELTDSEHMDIAYRFDVIIDTFDRIRHDSDDKPTGRTYYPFFIYKIIQTKFARYPNKLRLLDYIHIQHEKTLKKNEKWYLLILSEAKNPRLTQVDE